MLSFPFHPFYIFLYSSVHLRDLHSFPTRRSSDLYNKFLMHCTCLHRIRFRWQHLRQLTRTAMLGSTHCAHTRSEEHTSELQSRGHLVCRLLLEKKKQKK